MTTAIATDDEWRRCGRRSSRSTTSCGPTRRPPAISSGSRRSRLTLPPHRTANRARPRRLPAGRARRSPDGTYTRIVTADDVAELHLRDDATGLLGDDRVVEVSLRVDGANWSLYHDGTEVDRGDSFYDRDRRWVRRSDRCTGCVWVLEWATGPERSRSPSCRTTPTTTRPRTSSGTSATSTSGDLGVGEVSARRGWLKRAHARGREAVRSCPGTSR